MRPRFFAGQLLTEDDLDLLGEYVVGKNRLHNRALWGPGVVCGLDVHCDPCGRGNLIVSPGYAITNFHAHYDLTKRLRVSVQIDNLFNHHYYTAAQLANTSLTAQGAFQSNPFPAYSDGPFAGSSPVQSATFFSPGAPRRAWAELNLKF